MSGTDPTITCGRFNERLMDLLEGDMDDATRAAMEAHARGCAACGPLLADLRRLSAEASRLPTLTPSRDLWSGIAPRLETPVVDLARRRPFWSSPRVLIPAMAAAVVIAAVLGYRAAQPGVPVPSVPAAVTPAPRVAQQPETAAAAPEKAASTTPAPQPGGSTQARLAASRAARATPAAVEQSYDAEIDGLRTIIAKRRGQLDTATVAVLERNLATIDSAIAQCKSALAKDPNSGFLMQSLTQSLDTKVQLMRMTAGLPSTT